MDNKLPLEHCDLCFEKPIDKWDEALPIGNGLLGGLLWGESKSYRMSIDRGDLWDTTPYKGVESPEFCYPEMVRLAKEGNTARIREIFDAPYYNATPTKLPAGKLLFDFGSCDQLISRLRLSVAEAEINLINGEETRIVRSFIHATEQVGFVLVSGGEVAFKVEHPEFGLDDGTKDYHYDEAERSIANSLKKLAYPPTTPFSKDGFVGFVQPVKDGSSYGLIAYSGATSNGDTLIVYAVASTVDGQDWLDTAKDRLKRLWGVGYDEAFAAHTAWWADFWGESGVSLPDPLFDKQWYLTNYLIGSCSRKGFPPMPLQGVWTADNGELPPWKGDYHHDLNTQMCYYSYLKANHLNAGESFIDFLWDLKDCAQRFAKDFYKTDGICLPSVMTLHGKPLGGWAMYSLSPTNQLWLCQTFERHFTYTGDVNFLRERAYPYMKATAEMILGLLEKGADGMLRLPISSSPEIHDDEIEAFVTPNSNYDLAMLRYLFGKLISLCEEAGEDTDRARWEDVFKKLPELSVGKNNVLLLSPDEALNESHRHHAQAMAIHPLRLLNYDCEADRKVIDCTVHDLERLGTGWWVGYSFTWFAEFFAIQGNGEGAAGQLKMFWENFCSQNGFHLNGDYKRRGFSCFHYRPFTLEGNTCAADVVQEMLLRSENGETELFPAIPMEWKEASFTTLRAERGVLVSATISKGEVAAVTLKAEHDTTMRLKCTRGLQRLIPDKDGYCIVDLKAGEALSFKYSNLTFD